MSNEVKKELSGYERLLQVYRGGNLTPKKQIKPESNAINNDLVGHIFHYSNPYISHDKAFKYLGKKAVLYPSNKKDKKYMIQRPDGKMVHFGQLGYEDFTKHGDLARRQKYLTRTAKMRGDWKNDPYSANNLSRNILW